MISDSFFVSFRLVSHSTTTLNPFDDLASFDVTMSEGVAHPQAVDDEVLDSVAPVEGTKPEYVKAFRLADAFTNVELTDGQRALIPKLQSFLLSKDIGIFLLKGYAGTGKTFMMKGVVDYLNRQHRDVVLLAPTGRAAKVLGTRVKRRASTMHSHLYGKTEEANPGDPEDFRLVSELTVNSDASDTVYIVDEASMVSDREVEGGLLRFGSGRLLYDFFQYVADGQGQITRKVIFVGDVAQLPPVHMKSSPALDPQYLFDEYGIKANDHLLADIVRQEADSGIMRTALDLRQALNRGDYRSPSVPFSAFDDLTPVSARTMAKACYEVMGRKLTRHAIMIAHSNKRVQQLNFAFRACHFPGFEDVTVGDKLMVIMNTRINNQFVCNGDFAQVMRVGEVVTRTVELPKQRTKSGALIKPEPMVLRFRDVTLRFRNEEGELFMTDGRIIENELETPEAPNLSLIIKALLIDFTRRHPTLRKKTQEYQDALAQDPYVNAWHVRYGYAVTCHKSQGGEWDHVFVDCAWRRAERGHEYFRWLYTAVTRAKKHLYLANAPRDHVDDYDFG